MIKIVRAKMHGIHVTASALDYHGSITLDPEHCKAAGIFPMEFVEVWNKNSGKSNKYLCYLWRTWLQMLLHIEWRSGTHLSNRR